MDSNITIIVTAGTLAVIVVSVIVGIGLAFNRGRTLGEAQGRLQASEVEVARGRQTIAVERENVAASEKVRAEVGRELDALGHLPDADAVGMLFGAGAKPGPAAPAPGPGAPPPGHSA